LVALAYAIEYKVIDGKWMVKIQRQTGEPLL